MSCKRVSGLISDYVDGNLAGPVRAELESHLESCAQCSSELNATRKMLASLAGLGGLQSPIDCWSGVQGRVAAIDAGRSPWWRWVLRPVVAAPAVAAMALLALFLMWPVAEQVPMASDRAYAPEYSYYIGAHSHLQRKQAFADPDTVFIKAELQKATLVSEAEVE